MNGGNTMAFRFKRICSPIKGLKVNVNKGSISSSVGLPGLGATMGSRGVSANLGMPGTGLSYRSDVNWNKKQKSDELLPDDVDFYSDSDFDEPKINLQPKSEFQESENEEKYNKPSIENISQNQDNQNTDSQTELEEKQTKYHFLLWIVMILFSCFLFTVHLKVIPIILFVFATLQIIKVISRMNKKNLELK